MKSLIGYKSPLGYKSPFGYKSQLYGIRAEQILLEPLNSRKAYDFFSASGTGE